MSADRSSAPSNRTPPSGKAVQSQPVKREAAPATPRGISHSYQTGAGLYGHAPSYEKDKRPLLERFAAVRSNPNDPANQIYEKKHREGIERDKRIHQKPASRIQVDRLKAGRAKAEVHSVLTPKGHTNVQTRSAIESERERTIHHEEKQMKKVQGRARNAFNRGR